MGGAPKGLLASPAGEPLVSRLVGILRGRASEVVLVGRAEAYARTAEDLGVELLADEPRGAGPLGGLLALLARAGGSSVLAVACDMPYVTRELTIRLATHAPSATAVAPRRDGRWEPFFARWSAARALPVARARFERGALGLQGLLDEIGAVPLPLDSGEEPSLDDWDSPVDMERAHR